MGRIRTKSTEVEEVKTRLRALGSEVGNHHCCGSSHVERLVILPRRGGAKFQASLLEPSSNPSNEGVRTHSQQTRRRDPLTLNGRVRRHDLRARA